MSAHVLLNLSNELGKIVRGLPNILSLFRNEFNKFNKTSAQMLGSIYIYHISLTSPHIFGVNAFRFCHYVHNVGMDVIT